MVMRQTQKKNIKSNEQSQLSKPFNTESKRKDILLDFTKQIAQIKAKDDLMKLIREHFQTIFYFTHCTVTVIAEDKKTFRVYLIDPGSKLNGHKDYKELITRQHIIDDGIYNIILQSGTPVVFNVNKKTASGNAPFYMDILQQSGIRELIGISLAYETKQIGVLSFFSDKKNSFCKKSFPLIKSIVDYIFLAVNNALAIEAIQQREKEKEILLTVSKELTAVRSKEELLPLLKKQFESFSFYSDVSIAKVDDNQKTFSAFIINDHPVRMNHPGYQNMASARHLFPDGVFEVALESEKPLLFDIEELANLFNPLPYIKFLFENGTVEMVGVPLRDSNRQIGVLFLFSSKKLSLTELQLNLAQGIGNQLGAVVANILANEEIKNREKEKEILLSLSSDIAQVRDKNDLLFLVQNKLKNFFVFNDIVIVLVNDAQSTFTILLSVVDEGRGKHPEFEEIVTIEYPVKDGIHDEALKANGAVVLDIDNLMQNPDKHRGIQFIYDTGIKGIAAIKLVHKNKPIGILTLLSEVKNAFNGSDLNLLEGISHQLSVSVANILANEEITNRENEKSMLLSLSNEIAAVRDKTDLFRVVNSKLRELFSVSGFAIALISEDGKTHSAFLLDVEDRIMNHEKFKEVQTSKYQVNDGVFDTVIDSSDPVHFKVNDLPEGSATSAYISFWKKNGIEHIVGVPLRVGESNLGCLFFHLEPHLLNKINNNLLTGVCAQISIALSNILANEKIAKQLQEISRYKEQLEEEKSYLQEQVGGSYTYSDVIGSSAEMRKVFQSLSQVSFASSTVLLLGETGTGKELIAKAIHNSSPRKDRLMVKVNCAALPVNLIESELFGHEKGSFTGATERRIGKFELANHGTLFLDEIGEMPLDLQVKLLRAIQEKEIERIGGKVTIKTDVRLIAATNRNLQKEVDEGRFRRDLYYRLNVFPITLPPLRERITDIPLLVAHFTEKYAKNTGGAIKKISGKAMKELMAYNWPGNIRELEHLIERSILTTPENTIKNVHLPSDNRNEQKKIMADDFLKTHEENERDHILKVLNKCKGKIFGPGGAADILNLHVSTLNSKISKLGIKKNKTYT
jgi:formate hydrogenlyase transcriptional activator